MSLSTLPFDFASKHSLLLDSDASSLVVAPDVNWPAVLEVQRWLGRSPQLVTVDEDEFQRRLQVCYSHRSGSSESVMEGIGEELDLQTLAGSVEQSADLLSGEDDAPIIRLLNAILAESLQAGASDVHVEPYQGEARVRFRIDGVLRTVLTPAVALMPLLISRIKVMAKLDISEKRLPQDGRMSVKLGGRSIDLRVSTIPSTYGERVVMRLLDKSAVKLTLQDLGIPDRQLQLLRRMTARPHGMILVTGPTGSGKTTTLYALLQEMDRRERNIMTVEDPVEYDLPGISQTPINLRAGMSFAKGLRAILRQDPDVILIGEIRDQETAEISVQASMTGHLLLSTLHTNTAAGAVTRLQDLGIDPFLLASTLRGVMAQRLVRKLCVHCRTQNTEIVDGTEGEFYQAVGCDHCNGTGYSGRQAILEVVEVDERVQQMIHQGSSEAALQDMLRQSVLPIREEGLRLAASGVTSVAEVLRVTAN